MNIMLYNKRERVVFKTIDACIDLLENYRKAFLVRSTGFGKTWIMSDLIDSGRWKKVVYVYPLDSIKKDFVGKYSNKFNGVDVRCVSYTSLAMANRLPYSGRVEEVLPDLKDMEDGLFIFDEAHRIALSGPNKVGVEYPNIKSACRFLRMDYDTVCRRLANGWKLEDAFNPMGRRSVIINGVEYSSLKNACLKHGVNYDKILYRMKSRNVSAEEAINSLIKGF